MALVELLHDLSDYSTIKEIEKKEKAGNNPALSDDKVMSVKDTIIELDAEIEKLGKLVKEIMKNRLGKELTEKLNQLEESQSNAEGMLRPLKKIFSGSN